MMTTRTAMVELYGRKATNGFKLSVDEISYIHNTCKPSSLSYFLVILQQAKNITSKEELSDSYYAKLLKVSEITIKRSRLALEKAKMMKSIKKGGMTILLLGYEAVIIYEATGCDVIKVDAIKKISKALNIRTVDEFKNNLYTIEEMYRESPEMFD